MNEKKKLKIVLVILGIFILMAVILIVVTRDNATSKEQEKISYSDFNPIVDDSEFFTVQAIVNDFYSHVIDKEKNTAEILNPIYRKENSINNDNIFTKLNISYMDATFLANNISYYRNGNIVYYLVNGFITDFNIITEKYSYENNIQFFIIANTNKHKYSIYPMIKDTNESNFISAYDIGNDEVLNGSYQDESVTTNGKLKTYISVFLNLIYLDNERAYNMLDNNTKEYFGTKEKFRESTDIISEKISPTIFSYSKQDDGIGTIYEIIDNKQQHIIIKESKIMDYTIGLDF